MRGLVCRCRSRIRALQVGGDARAHGIAGIMQHKRRFPPPQALYLEGVDTTAGEHRCATSSETVPSKQVAAGRGINRLARQLSQTDDSCDRGRLPNLLPLSGEEERKISCVNAEPYRCQARPIKLSG